jgi:hypothetical protein
VKLTSSLVTLLLLSVGSGVSAPSWPTIQPVAKTYRIEIADKPRLTLTILNEAGSAAVYRINCATPDTPADVFNFDFSGDFECMLQTVPPDFTFSTYFTENVHQDRDWESRARFFAREVALPCGAIPDFGGIRSFRLRGMNVTLAMFNISFLGEGDALRLKSFDFQITVTRDPSARTKITEPPLIAPEWKQMPCRLDNSVPVHFRMDEKEKSPQR